MPDVVAKAMALVQDPEASLEDFEQLLARDPPLVASVLRLANSPLHGLGRKRDTIREAIVGVGFKGLRGLLLCSTLKRFQGPQYSCYGKDPRSLWRHAVSVAAGARALARETGAKASDQEELFVAGLLHDLGKLLLAPFLTAKKHDLTAAREPAHVVELRELGIDHPEAGGIVAAKWGLNPMLHAVITHHHAVDCPEQFQQAVATVRLADGWATERGQGAGTVAQGEAAVAADLEHLGLQPEDWYEIREVMTAAMTQAVAQD
ncbi:MAG TPA: HDOD domain-containing protein [Planctomycetota bacterium]|nr:HDOD domain-containing protein [Planctomycetota bacterium]